MSPSFGLSSLDVPQVVMVRGIRNFSLASASGMTTSSQDASEVAPRQRRGANNLNFSILGESKRVFHVNPEIAHRVFDLAMTKKDLDGTEVAGRPVDY